MLSFKRNSVFALISFLFINVSKLSKSKTEKRYLILSYYYCFFTAFVV